MHASKEVVYSEVGHQYGKEGKCHIEMVDAWTAHYGQGGAV